MLHSRVLRRGPFPRAAALLGTMLGALVLAPTLAHAAPCQMPSAQPTWADFADGSVAFRQQVFGRPGVVVATAGGGIAKQMRVAGAVGAYWEMNLPDYVGTPAAPARAGDVKDNADYLQTLAVRAAGCDTPWIALNELLLPNATAPFHGANLQYRSNVLQLVQRLAANGDRVFLLIPPSGPNTRDSAARAYWRRIAKAADIVLEDYFSAPTLDAEGALLSSRETRMDMRRRLRQMRGIGIPAAKLGLILGFQGQQGGRMGLQPASAWFEFVKLQALAARQVATEIPISTIWSWGWRTSGLESVDPDKAAAACVYLWTRNPALCDAPAVGPFDTSLTEGQIILPSDVQCRSTAGAKIRDADITRWTEIDRSASAAETLLLDRISSRFPVKGTTLTRVEKGIIAREFEGSRAKYKAYLKTVGISRSEARSILLDEIHSAIYDTKAGTATISYTAVKAWYRAHRSTLVRSVRASRRIPELGRRSAGFALYGSFASPAVRTATGKTTALATSRGLIRLRVTGPKIRLRKIKIAKAAPTIEALLLAQVQSRLGAAAQVAAQQSVLDILICRGDELPSVGVPRTPNSRLRLDD